jgi:dihydrofolate synthase / folylpolyglutamate synthase
MAHDFEENDSSSSTGFTNGYSNCTPSGVKSSSSSTGFTHGYSNCTPSGVKSSSSSSSSSDPDSHIYHLYNLRRKGVKLDLFPIINSLKEFNNPQNGYPSISITGTNGKGSVSKFVQVILKNHGLKTGLFTSPHIHRFGERIQTDDISLTDGEMKSLLTLIESKNPDLSFFETATLMAYLKFSQEKVNVAIMEVGLGGRLDSTNSSNPKVTAITSIGNDHAASLTGSLEKIAWEKVGICKNGVPVVISSFPPLIKKVILNSTKARGVPVYELNKDFFIKKTGANKAIWKFNDQQLEINLPLAGVHQMENMALALTISSLFLDKPLNEKIVMNSFNDFIWPGRFEKIGNFILDGAHNPLAAEYLVKTLKEVYGGSFNFLVGMMADKDVGSFVKHFRTVCDDFYCTKPPSDRSMSSEDLKYEVEKQGFHVKGFNDNIQNLLDSLDKNKLTVVTGSFYLAGKVRSLLLNNKEDSLPLTDPVS